MYVHTYPIRRPSNIVRSYHTYIYLSKLRSAWDGVCRIGYNSTAVSWKAKTTCLYSSTTAAAALLLYHHSSLEVSSYCSAAFSAVPVPSLFLRQQKGLQKPKTKRCSVFCSLLVARKRQTASNQTERTDTDTESTYIRDTTGRYTAVHSKIYSGTCCIL